VGLSVSGVAVGLGERTVTDSTVETGVGEGVRVGSGEGSGAGVGLAIETVIIGPYHPPQNPTSLPVAAIVN
jgi:hypothetical protein